MEVPEVVILRLPQYLRVLTHLLDARIQVVSSQYLGSRLQMTPAQIRKDLSYFGRFGKQGRGYDVRYLLGELRQVLGLGHQWDVALVGAGRLGRAIIRYPGFAPDGFRVVAAFDSDTEQVGRRVEGITIQGMDEMESTIRGSSIHIGIVAVPAAHAQNVIDELVRCGVKAILNYAPTTPQVPRDVKVRNIDPALALQSMTYYLRFLVDAPPARGSASRG